MYHNGMVAKYVQIVHREYERVKESRNEAREKASRIERENKQLRTEVSPDYVMVPWSQRFS